MSRYVEPTAKQLDDRDHAHTRTTHLSENTEGKSLMSDTAKAKKQAFDAPRNSMYSFDPLALCIVGGKVLPEDEQGPLDTEEDEDNALWDKRLRIPLDEPFKANVYTYGVDTPVLITKIDGVPTVIAGKRRVRAARLGNVRRLAAGESLITVDTKTKRGSALDNMGTLFRENEGRSDNSLMDKIEGLKRYMNRGVSIEAAAVNFNITTATAKTYLSFDDNAVNATKKAVEQGRISPSAAIALARIREPEKQREALEGLIEHAPAGAKGTARGARLAANHAGVGKAANITDKRTLSALIDAVKVVPHPHNTSDKTLAWWQGVEDALALVSGSPTTDKRLTEILAEVRKASK